MERVRPSRTLRPRPRGATEDELGFRRRAAVRWLAPGVLVRTGARSVLASIFGLYSDKRELQGTLPGHVHEHGDGDDVWLDYVADLGDGFDATYSVASLLAAPRLEPDGAGQPLPRGSILVMGGDEVYPSASPADYEERSKGVYRAALPAAPEAETDRPTLFALPGNHDWYDGLTSFLRVFGQQRPFGGWATEQTRSYFAIALPQGWWLYALDTQFDDYLDGPQLDYFRAAAERLRPGDAIILCTPSPYWVKAGSGGDTGCYDTVEFFLREIVRPRGASVPLMLSGDKHHYTRYAERGGPSQLVTCGLGGAYLVGTHTMPSELTLPSRRTRVREHAEPTWYDLQRRSPGKRESERLAAGVFRIPWRNPWLWLLTGSLQTVMTLALLLGLGASDEQGAFFELALWAPAVLSAILLVLAGVTFARLDLPRANQTNALAGLAHALAHLALSFGWAMLVRATHDAVLPNGTAGDWLVVGLFAVLTPTVLGVLDAELIALYLVVASRFGINSNEVFAGQSIEDHKGFLRMRIDESGRLTVYPILLRSVCREWTACPEGEPMEPWLVPAHSPLRTELIEEPFTVEHPGRTTACENPRDESESASAARGSAADIG